MEMQQRAKKLALIRGEHTLVVGVDIAKRRHWASILDGRTELPVGSPFRFQNNSEGFSRLLGQINRAKEQTGATRAVVGMEPTGHYWKPLAWYLRQAGLTVVLVNPAHVKRSKELDDNSPTKSDRKDTWVIAQLVMQGRFFEVYLPDGVYAELRGLAQARQQHRTKLNAALNQLQAVLDEFFPEYTEVFAELLGQASLYVLQHRPLPPDVLAVPVEQLAAELRAASNGRVGLKRAMTAAAKNREFRALYEHFKTRPQNPLKGKQALVALACKLLRVLFTLAKKQCTYDPAKALGAWRTEQLGIAA